MNDVLVGHDEAADGRHGFAVGTHDDVHLLLEPEMLRGAPAGRSQHAYPVSVVDHQTGAVCLAQASDVGERGNVPFHAVNAVDYDEFASVAAFLQHELETAHVVVLELPDLGKREPARVEDAG